MAFFTKESLDHLRSKVDLVEVISQHIDLKRAGASYKALCPFHDEKTPSFTLQRGDSHYHCFGCGAHGDSLQFVMEYMSLSFFDAVEYLGDKFQVPLEKVEHAEGPRGPSKKLMKQALNKACSLYQYLLLHTEEGHGALEYLYSRGLDLDFIRLFRIGLAPKNQGMLQKILHRDMISNEVMREVGLLSQRGRDFFSDRITFPISSPTGDVIGFSARKYKEDTFGGKYMNTSETELFKKSRVLYGMNYSRRRIAKERRAIIVEGQLDALRLIKYGFNITVAGQGTAFGDGHVNELVNLGVKTIYLALDADTAGYEAAKKIGHLFQREGVEVYVLNIPLGKDPDTILVEEGPDAFKRYMEESLDYLSFLVKEMSKSYDMTSPAGKAELVRVVSQQIREWNDSVMVHESLKKLAHIVHVPEEMVGIHEQKMRNIYIKKVALAGVEASVDPDKILETDILRWLVVMGEESDGFIALVRANISEGDFKIEACRKVYAALMAVCDGKGNPDTLTLISYLDDEESQRMVSEMLEKKVNKERAEVHLREAIQKLLERNWMYKREAVRAKIQSGACSDDEALLLAKEFNDLKNEQPTLVEV
jgi:DNA primase